MDALVDLNWFCEKLSKRNFAQRKLNKETHALSWNIQSNNSKTKSNEELEKRLCSDQFDDIK